MLPTDSFSIKPVNFHLIHYVFSWLGAFAICLIFIEMSILVLV